MSTALWCLLVVAVLPYVLSVVSGTLRFQQTEAFDNKHPRQQMTTLHGAAARALAAQQNAWESLGFFTAVVALAELAGADPARTASPALLFLVTRLLHPVLYLANLDVLRSLVFMVGLAAGAWILVIAVGA